MGLRFAVNDSIGVAGVSTTAACPAVAYDALAHVHVVRRLLYPGATLVGNTNLDQLTCGLNGTRSPHGIVPKSAKARYVAGGSSSGSAATVAASEVGFSQGTDTVGSGRMPVGLNNIVGTKSTRRAAQRTWRGTCCVTCGLRLHLRAYGEYCRPRVAGRATVRALRHPDGRRS